MLAWLGRSRAPMPWVYTHSTPESGEGRSPIFTPEPGEGQNPDFTPDPGEDQSPDFTDLVEQLRVQGGWVGNKTESESQPIHFSL